MRGKECYDKRIKIHDAIQQISMNRLGLLDTFKIYFIFFRWDTLDLSVDASVRDDHGFTKINIT